MKLGAVDVEHSTRVHTLPEAWTFIMERLDRLDCLKVSITAQDWRREDEDEWQDTYLVKVMGRERSST